MATVLITGAGRGIGLALTKEFTRSGSKVIATYRDEISARDLLGFAKEHPSVTPIALDVTDEKSFGLLKNQLKVTSVDILINNSGVIGDKRPLLDLDMEIVQRTLEVNTLGPMRITRLVMPHMNKNGKIAQITSRMGSISESSGGYYDYRMSKAALNMFHHALSKEFPNLTCLALHPGWVKTDMGGAEATLTVEESARGLFKVISESTVEQSGHFVDYSGQHIAW